jgi:proline iminopeptidase
MRIRCLILIVAFVSSSIPSAVWAHADASKPPASSSAMQAQATGEGSVRREGFTLHYRTVGSGVPFLLLGGGPGTEVAYLAGIAQELSSSYKCILLEQRGTGRSQLPNPTPDQMTVKLFVEDIEALRASLNLDRFMILGHSWGGMLAMAYAVAHPDRVDSLILVDSGGMDLSFGANFRDNVSARASMGERQELEKADAAIERASDAKTLNAARISYSRLRTPFYFYDRKLADKILALLPGDSNQQRVFLLMQNDLANHYDVRSGMKSLSRPVLIIQGRQDPMPETVAIEIHETVTNSQLVFIDQCGHFPWIEQPTSFYRAVRTFLDKQP